MFSCCALHTWTVWLPHVVGLANGAVSCTASSTGFAFRATCSYVHLPAVPVFEYGLHRMNFIGISEYSSDSAIRDAYISCRKTNMSKEWRLLALYRMDCSSLSMSMKNCIVFAKCAMFLDGAVLVYFRDVAYIDVTVWTARSASPSSKLTRRIDTVVIDYDRPRRNGGGVKYIPHDIISKFVKTEQNQSVVGNTYRYLYVNHFVFNDDNMVLPEVPKGHIRLNVPLSSICEQIPVKELRALSKMHVFNVNNISCMTKASLVDLFSNHTCNLCHSAYTVLKVCPVLGKAAAKAVSSKKVDIPELPIPFPPPPLDERVTHSILTSACDAMSPDNFVEAGCCVCAQLVPMKQLSDS